jgi:hypothetical protein
MWKPRRLTALWASTARYRDSFTFTLYLCLSECIPIYKIILFSEHVLKTKTVVWYVIPYSLVEVFRFFGRTFCHLQDNLLRYVGTLLPDCTASQSRRQLRGVTAKRASSPTSFNVSGTKAPNIGNTSVLYLLRLAWAKRMIIHSSVSKRRWTVTASNVVISDEYVRIR